MAGAGFVEGTINGIGERAGNAALEEVIMNLYTRRDYLNCCFDADTHKLYRLSKIVGNITNIHTPANKAVVGDNAFTHQSGIHQHGVLADRSTYEIMSPSDIGAPSGAGFRQAFRQACAGGTPGGIGLPFKCAAA